MSIVMVLIFHITYKLKMTIIKREALLKVATNESMWDKRNIKINGGSHAVLDKPYRIKPAMDANGAQTRGFSGAEEKKFLPQIIGIEPNAPDFSKRCMQYWQSLHKVFDANGLNLNIGFEVDEENVKAWQAASETDKWKFGEPLVLIDYLYYRYCLNWVAVANSYNIFKAKQHAKKIEFYFYTEDEFKQAQTKEVEFTNRVFKSYIKAIEDNLLTEGILRYFERGKTAHEISENIGEKYIYDELDAQDKQRLLLHIQKTVPGKFVEIVEDPQLKPKIFIYQCLSANILHNPKGSTQILMGDLPLGQTTIEAIRTIQSDGELRQDLSNKLEAVTKKA